MVRKKSTASVSPSVASGHDVGVDESEKSVPIDWRQRLSVGASDWNEWRRSNQFAPLRIHSAFLADMAGLQGINLSYCDLGY